MTIPDEGCYTEILNKQLLSYFRENSFVGYCISSRYAKILGHKLFRTREFPRSGSTAKDGEKEKNTQGTAGGPGGCDRTLAVKSRKNAQISVFLAQAACVRHACLRAPGVAWLLLLPWLSRSLLLFSLRVLLLTHFGETPVGENLFLPIFWQN